MRDGEMMLNLLKQAADSVEWPTRRKVSSVGDASLTPLALEFKSRKSRPPLAPHSAVSRLSTFTRQRFSDAHPPRFYPSENHSATDFPVACICSSSFVDAHDAGAGLLLDAPGVMRFVVDDQEVAGLRHVAERVAHPGFVAPRPAFVHAPPAGDAFLPPGRACAGCGRSPCPRRSRSRIAEGTTHGTPRSSSPGARVRAPPDGS